MPGWNISQDFLEKKKKKKKQIQYPSQHDQADF